MAREERCGLCLYWDHRVEAEIDEHTGYCSVHEMMKRDQQTCPKFKRRTKRSEAEYYQELYDDGSNYSPDEDVGDVDEFGLSDF